MMVVIAGMQRSGSTFSFNAAREFIGGSGRVEAFSTDKVPEVALSSSGKPPHLIMKTHNPDVQMSALIRSGEAACICTVRRPEDAIASWMKTFGFAIEDSIDAYKLWLEWHNTMHKYVLNIRVEEIDKYPIAAILKIGHYLVGGRAIGKAPKIWWKYRKHQVLKASKRIAVDGAETTNIGFSYYDNRTFFHRNHVSSLRSRPASELLPERDLRMIRERLSGFVDVNGNYNW